MQNSRCAVILAASDGKQMKSSRPAAMAEVLFQPMIDWVLDAVQNAGITPETTPEEACELLIAQFPTLQIDGLTGSLAWESTGEVTKTPNVYTIEGGVYVKME